ncbi:hypothetical protein N9164_12605, partial [Draconibacterium sp.]|nr:hypothetical protein [Draconibacterium sp.]
MNERTVRKGLAVCVKAGVIEPTGKRHKCGVVVYHIKTMQPKPDAGDIARSCNNQGGPNGPQLGTNNGPIGPDDAGQPARMMRAKAPDNTKEQQNQETEKQVFMISTAEKQKALALVAELRAAY